MIGLLGLSYKTAPIKIREKIAFSKNLLKKALIFLKKYPSLKEVVILSTCNRVEIYFFPFSFFLEEEIKKFIYNFHQLKENIDSYLYKYEGKEAIYHLFKVVSSLDSMIIGENQILKQVKEAYFAAKELKMVGNFFSLVFEEAIKLGRKVRQETEIGKGSVSIGTASIELVKETIKNFEGKSVLIIGAGKMAEITLSNLYNRGVKEVFVLNRTYEKALNLAERFLGKAIRYEDLKKVMEKIDILITAADAPHFIIKKEFILEIMKERVSPLFIIDLGVPRNVEKIDLVNVYIYDIDDLKKIMEKNIQQRFKEIKKVIEIIDKTVNEFIEKNSIFTCISKN